MLRVLHVASAATASPFVHTQVVGLARRGHDVRVVLPVEGPLADQLRASGIRTEIIPIWGHRLAHLPRLAGAGVRLVRLLREFQPQVVHSHLFKATLACRLAGPTYPQAVRISQIPTVAHLNDPLLRRLEAWTVRLDDMVIGTCQAFADRYRALGARHVTASYHGCDVHRLDPAASGTGFRAEFGVPDDAPVVGMLAHMYPPRMDGFREIGVKGHEVFIDAAQQVLQRFPAAHLFVVGDQPGDDKSYRHSLEERARRRGLTDRLHFTGARSDVEAVLAAMDVVVAPSLSESGCYAAVEALLMRKPVVASEVGGLPETVQQGETGVLVPPADPRVLAQAIAGLLEDPEQRYKMGELGRERMLYQFDIERTLTQIEEIYHSTIADCRRAGTDQTGRRS